MRQVSLRLCMELALKSLRDSADGVGLPPHYVAMSTFFAFLGEQLVGFTRLRHELNTALREEGGHIGYFVRAAFRRRGVATQILAQALKCAHSRGIVQVLLTCDADNIASRRVIEKNGGILECETVSRVSERLIRRYWINTRADVGQLAPGTDEGGETLGCH